MNLSNKTTVRFYLSLILLIVMTMVTTLAKAQKEYTTLSKNINPEAQGLIHELSTEGDSLHLKSGSIFYKVTFLNSLDRKVYNFNPPVLESSIPLHDIIVGDYTVLVYKSDRIIVFHISRLLEINKPLQLIASQENSTSPDHPLAQTVLSKIDTQKTPTAQIKKDGGKKTSALKLDKKAVKYAVNDLIVSSETSGRVQAYNLTSTDRSQMQSREDYRRNNLRPNGKPY